MTEKLIWLAVCSSIFFMSSSCEEQAEKTKYPYLTTYFDLGGEHCSENEDIKYGDEKVADSVRQMLEHNMYSMYIQNYIAEYTGSVCCSDFCSAINSVVLAEVGLTDSALSSIKHINSCEWVVYSEQDFSLFRHPDEIDFFEAWALHKILVKIAGIKRLKPMSSTYFHDSLYSIPFHQIIHMDHHYYNSYHSGGVAPNFLDTIEKFKGRYPDWKTLEYYRLNFISEILKDTVSYDSILYNEVKVGKPEVLLNVNQLYGGSLGSLNYKPLPGKNMTDFQLVRYLYYTMYFNNERADAVQDIAIIEVINLLLSNNSLIEYWPETKNWILRFTDRKLLVRRIVEFENSFSYKLLPREKKEILKILKSATINTDAGNKSI